MLERVERSDRFEIGRLGVYEALLIYGLVSRVGFGCFGYCKLLFGNGVFFAE